MADLKLRRRIISAFNLSGFRLKSDACAFLAEQLAEVDPHDQEDWIVKITDCIQQKSLESPVIEKDALVLVIKEITRGGLTNNEPVFSVISAFEVPDFEYNFDRKIFLPLNKRKGNYFVPCGDPKDKADVFVSRHTYVYQRTARHSLFSAPAVNMHSDEQTTRFKLRSAESLLCTSSEQHNVAVLGMLVQLKDCKYFLEDTSGAIELDLSETAFQDGIPTECSILLAEGWYADRIFHVRGLGQPPAELSRTSRVFFGNVNTFGGESQKCLKNSVNLAALEASSPDTIVFMSDVWIDKQIVIDKLEVLFTGFSEHPPVAFVLMGNFLSGDVDYYEQWDVLRERFKVFGELVAQFPTILEKSRFVLVPGSYDPTADKLLPRPPLPDPIVAEFVKRVPKTDLGTNPCRIQYCTQEIVVFRDNLMTRMCQNTINYPRSGNIVSHFVRSVVAQGHLSPFPLLDVPVFWKHDAALRLYPLPDLVVIGDRVGPFTDSHMECQVSITSSFVSSKFSFKVYLCANKTIEESQLPEE